VERLRAAGAIFTGRTNTPEFGWKAVTDNLLFGITRNPWHLDCTPGGSSGGAAAGVAAGMGPIGMGGDGGGSIRIPATFCGLVGHKCSFGRVPNYPTAGDGALLHTGPLTRTVADTALVYDVLAGPDDRDRDSLPAPNVRYLDEIEKGIAGLRIAYSPDLNYAQVDAQVAERCRASAMRFSEAGAHVETVELDWHDPFKHWATMFYGGIGATLGNAMARHGDEVDPGLKKSVEKGLTLSAADYVKALMHRNNFWQKARRLFDDYDLLITPAVAVPPFPVGMNIPDPLPGHERWKTSWTPFTYPFNLTGQPAASVPAGFVATADGSDAGLPVGIQIVGRRFDDATVLRAARAWEQIEPWRDRRPPILDEVGG
jgi:aspartyl-tRNA(Asn)/glutamyl-tRNA(Gln) amidotransferase subunit A